MPNGLGVGPPVDAFFEPFFLKVLRGVKEDLDCLAGLLVRRTRAPNSLEAGQTSRTGSRGAAFWFRPQRSSASVFVDMSLTLLSPPFAEKN